MGSAVAAVVLTRPAGSCAGTGPAGASPAAPTCRRYRWPGRGTVAGQQLTPAGYIAGSTPGTAEYSGTVNTLLALAAANVDVPLARTGLAYMEQPNTDPYVTVEGSDGPGQLSLLILAAHALGADPTNFGGTNLVVDCWPRSRPAAPTPAGSERTPRTRISTRALRPGPGAEALKAAGMTSGRSGDLVAADAQCPNGGWTIPTR